MMNKYFKLNKSILRKRISPKNISRSDYIYLLRNGVGQQLLEKLSSTLSDKIRGIDKLKSEKYIKTIELIARLCKEEKIDFIVFKTHKYYGEIPTGDLDLIVKKKDIKKIVSKLKKNGFLVINESEFKYECTKEGYSKIEPRYEVEFHSIKPFDTSKVWKNSITKYYKNIKFKVTDIHFETAYNIMVAFYGPRYINLYQAKLYQKASTEGMASYLKSTRDIEDLRKIKDDLLKEGNFNNKFPIFLSDILYLKLWVERVLLSNQFAIFDKAKHIIFFFYIKYKYLFFDRLEFDHKLL